MNSPPRSLHLSLPSGRQQTLRSMTTHSSPCKAREGCKTLTPLPFREGLAPAKMKNPPPPTILFGSNVPERLIPKGSQQVAGGRSEAQAAGHSCLFNDPGRGRSTPGFAATPAGVVEHSNRFRRYRFAQPPATRCNPSGIKARIQPSQISCRTVLPPAPPCKARQESRKKTIGEQ